MVVELYISFVVYVLVHCLHRMVEDSTSATDRRSDSVMSIERADLEALRVEVV